MKNKLFLNADVGEGMRNDMKLMPYLTYANIACGGHFGDKESIYDTIVIAKKNKVLVGAHPSYPDKENFGRKSIQISKEKLEESLKEQINSFLTQCNLLNVKMNHIKLHGALYNDVFTSKELVEWFLDWVEKNYSDIQIFIPLSAKKFIKEKKENYIIEAFADRNYNNDLTLVTRSNSKAIIGSIKKVKEHISAIRAGNIVTIEGNKISVNADTLCIHGDHPLAIDIAKELCSN